MSTNLVVTRRDVVRACKRRGWQIQPAALNGVLEYCRGNAEHDLNSLLDAFLTSSTMMAATRQKTVTLNHWKRFLEEEGLLEEENDDAAAASRHHGGGAAGQRGVGGVGSSASFGTKKSSSSSSSRKVIADRHRPRGGVNDDHDIIEVVSAFRTPKLVYEPMRKQFRVEERVQSLFGTPEDKVNMLSQRYALIHQRLLRHDLFRPNNLGHASSSSSYGGSSSSQQHEQRHHQHKLTPIESLLGKGYGKDGGTAASRTIILLAVLIQIEEGQYYLEDPTGQLPVSFQPLSLAAIVDGFFVTENNVLLVEGNFQDGIFFVQRLGHPLLELRRDTVAAIQQQVSHPAFSMPANSNLSSNSRAASSFDDQDETSFVLLSDVHLDNPRVLQQLEGFLATFENYSPSRLPVFVMMGNFEGGNGSNAGGGGNGNAHLDELGSLLGRFPILAKHAHFVLIPGPRDSGSTNGGGGHVLPYPNLLPRDGFGRVRNVHWATNPCRIRWKGKEMVVFRYDLLHLMQREQVLLQRNRKAARESDEEEEEDDEDIKHMRMPHCRLVKTILDQGHLVPVAGVPIYWNYSHALSLYPLPDVLVLGGDSFVEENGYYELYGGCHIVHPGSMSRAGSYATFAFSDSFDDDDDDEEDDEFDGGVGARVDHGKLGDLLQTS